MLKQAMAKKIRDIFGNKVSPEKYLQSAFKENPFADLPIPKKFRTIAPKNTKKALSLENFKIVSINNPFFRDEKK
ncbi:MAG: hypothetical protein F6K47_27450 [Symploca sp. SIO2E6]|nr:hypothetical protein [Symploca sp. SIO2E6]